VTPPIAPSLVIFLHGVNASGADLAPLGRLWRKTLPDTFFAAPDAPFSSGFGHQWFSLDGVTPENRPIRVVAARAAFDRLLSEIIAAQGLSDHPERVALVGFSQGSIMALDALASGRWRFGAVVAFSGRLATPPPLTPSRATPALLIHGDDDSVIPESESRNAAALLQQSGVETRLHVLPGVDHCISPDGARLALAFLSGRGPCKPDDLKGLS
jgi:phospholipase/carboxylesterase